MDTIDQWLVFLLGAAALHGVWLAVLLFSNTARNKGLLFLGITITIFSLHLLNGIFFLTGFILAFPHMLGLFYPFLFLLGPAYFLFMKYAFHPEFQLRKVHLWHLLPAVVVFCQSLPLFLTTRTDKLKIVEWAMTPGDHYTWMHLFSGNTFVLLLIGYVAYSRFLARKRERHSSSSKQADMAGWLKKLSRWFLVLLILDLILKVTLFACKTPVPVVEYVMSFLLALMIHLISYQTISRLGIFFQPLPALQQETAEGKYKTSPLSNEHMQAHQTALLQLMNHEHLYLEANLKISDLAARLNIPSHHLSQLLNEGMDTNFYDFVNRYRVEAVKQRLKDAKYRHYSILAIGLECGFTNKTTFNRTFKKLTGMTPSEFLSRENVTS